MARRLHAIGTSGYEAGFNLALHEGRLNQPLLAEYQLSISLIPCPIFFTKTCRIRSSDFVFNVIRATPQHSYQILTKRARRLPQYFARRECPKNAWLGVSVENKRSGVPRIAELVKVEAAVRFLSIEPLLEDVGAINLAGIHWVIVGGESGHQARRMQPSG